MSGRSGIVMSPSAWELLAPARRSLWNQGVASGSRGVLRALQVFLIGGGIWSVLALVAYRLLRSFGEYPEIAHLLTLKILSIALAIGFAITLVASTIAALGVLFLSRETRAVLVAPVDWLQLYLSQLVRVALHGGWAAMLVIVPVLVGVAFATGGGWRFWVLVMAGAPSILVAAASSAVILALALSRAGGAARAKTVLGLGAVLLGGLAFVAFRASGAGDLLAMPGAGDSMRIVDLLDTPTAWWLPTEWWARALIAAQYGIDLYAVGAMVGAAGLMTTLAAITYGFFYQPAVLSVTSATPVRNERGWERRFWGAVSNVSSPFAAEVARKDWRRLVRETSGWSHWILATCGLCVFFLNLRALPSAAAGDATATILLDVVALLSSSVAALVLASLATYTVLPTLSLEGPILPLLRTAPIAWRTVVRAKAGLGVAIFVPAGVVIALVAQMVLGTSLRFAALAVVLSASLAFAVVSFAVWFGSRYPRFDVTTPAAIASSLGATFFTLAAFVLAMGATAAVAPFALTTLARLPAGELLDRLEAIPYLWRLAMALLGVAGPVALGTMLLVRSGANAERWADIGSAERTPR